MKKIKGHTITFYINIDKTSDPRALQLKKETEGGVVTLFLAFCMHATGIMRLISKESIEEFLYRLAIILKDYEIIPKFFINDTLVDFERDGVKVKVGFQDIIDHLGMEISDWTVDFVPREAWLEKIGKYWRNACIHAVFIGGPLLDRIIIGKNKYKIASNKPKPVDNEYKEVIKLFVKEAMNTIGEGPITDLSLRFRSYQEMMEDFVKFSKTTPLHQFKYESIPLNIKMDFFKHIFGGPASKNKQDFEEVVSDEKGYLHSLIYLAWLWENGYIIVHQVKIGNRVSHFADVDVRISIDYENYDGLNNLGFGINLYDSYYDYRLYELAHLLKEKGSKE